LARPQSDDRECAGGRTKPNRTYPPAPGSVPVSDSGSRCPASGSASGPFALGAFRDQASSPTGTSSHTSIDSDLDRISERSDVVFVSLRGRHWVPLVTCKKTRGEVLHPERNEEQIRGTSSRADFHTGANPIDAASSFVFERIPEQPRCLPV